MGSGRRLERSMCLARAAATTRFGLWNLDFGLDPSGTRPKPRQGAPIGGACSAEGRAAGARRARRLGGSLGTALAAALAPWACGCIPVLHIAAPTKLTLRPSADPTKSMVVGMSSESAFGCSDGELEAVAFGICANDHETYLAFLPLVSDPVLDVERAVRVYCQLPGDTGLDAGRVERLDCRVDLVLGKRFSGCVPDWVAGAYTGVVPVTVRRSGQRLYVDLPEAELRCAAGGTGSLRVGGRVVACKGAKYLAADREWFARIEARASGQADAEAKQR